VQFGLACLSNMKAVQGYSMVQKWLPPCMQSLLHTWQGSRLISSPQAYSAKQMTQDSAPSCPAEPQLLPAGLLLLLLLLLLKLDAVPPTDSACICSCTACCPSKAFIVNPLGLPDFSWDRLSGIES
jgi:hypothetical protein